MWDGPIKILALPGAASRREGNVEGLMSLRPNRGVMMVRFGVRPGGALRPVLGGSVGVVSYPVGRICSQSHAGCLVLPSSDLFFKYLLVLTLLGGWAFATWQEDHIGDDCKGHQDAGHQERASREISTARHARQAMRKEYCENCTKTPPRTATGKRTHPFSLSYPLTI